MTMTRFTELPPVFPGKPHPNAADLSGRRFGRLLVIHRTHDHVGPAGHKSVQWACRCDCGDIAIVMSANLSRGTSRSCGCLKADLIRARAEDLTNQKFGRLLVLGLSVERSPRGGPRWECVCTCGQVTRVLTASLTSGKTRSCGCLRADARAASNRSRRKDVVTYRTAHERIWTERGRADEHQCADCGETAAQWSYDKTDPNELRQPNRNGWPQVTELVYSLDPYRYQPRCLSCHIKFDHSNKTKRSAS